MKRRFALLLASLLLAVSLTACGKDRQPDDASGSTDGGAVSGDTGSGTAGDTGGGLTGDTSGGLTGDTGSGTAGDTGSGLTGDTGSGGTGDSVTGGVNGGNGGTMMDGALDTMENTGDAARSAVQSAGDRLGGYTYEEMVRNGRVF